MSSLGRKKSFLPTGVKAWNTLQNPPFPLLMGTDIPYNQMGQNVIIFSMTEEIKVCGRRHYNLDRIFMPSKSPNYSVY